MKRCFFALRTALALTICACIAWPVVVAAAESSPASGTCTSLENVSELSGTWKGEDLPSIRKITEGNIDGVLNLTFTDDGRVRGTKFWRSAEDHSGFDVSGKSTTNQTEDVHGMFDHVTCELTLIESQESGILRGVLLPNGSMRYLFYQSGADSIVSIGVLQRQD